MMSLRIFSVALSFALTMTLTMLGNFAWGETSTSIRWTGSEDPDGTFAHVIETISRKMGYVFHAQDFLLQEDRDLAFNHYKRYMQLVSGIPVHGKSVRIWTEKNSDRVIQLELNIETPNKADRLLAPFRALKLAPPQTQIALSSEQTMRLIRAVIAQDPDDAFMHGVTWTDEWKNEELRRLVKAHGKHGYHFIEIDLASQTVKSHQYREFPQDDSDLTIQAQVYPIWEETEELHPSQRTPKELRHILSTVPQSISDLYAPMQVAHYYDSTFDPVRGETEEGRAQGLWSMGYLKSQAALIRAGMPLVSNNWSTGVPQGVLLQGRFATINIHPDALTAYGPWSFQAQPASAFFPHWIDISLQGKEAQEMVPSQAYYGKPLLSPQEAWNRPARRLADHNPREYLNDGFDELQVYYAIDTLFEELRARGFQDPELSTRPFNAYLFNPDIAYRDNAFYTDDTINFTTYSPNQQNFARDNSTIWHELGHGVMDRLMGDQIELADTGGLSEGMADFVAALVIQAVTDGTPFTGSNHFRIINKTGFFLTNEVHDDGEAYGGTMKDFLDSVIAQNGKQGLAQVTDVVLEAMRLTRDYPGLTADEWFKHILFADELGRPGLRAPSELKPFLLKALSGRNFKIDGGSLASFSLVNAETGEEIVAGKPGARDNPIRVEMPASENRNFTLTAGLKSSDQFNFHYPVQIRVQYQEGPLQGAIHWTGKENKTQTYTLNNEAELVNLPLQVSGKCDRVNRTDGSCVDYAYIQIFDQDHPDHPVAKKRFYLRIINPSF